ncbi:MAG: TlpA family protein disulfide reductase [Chloroflexota bacterium]|nr:TlpA family protein disulfide reductase [Chloroflexota bacterium]
MTAGAVRRRRPTGTQTATLVVLAGVLALLGLIGYRLLNPAAASEVENSARINSEGRPGSIERGPAQDFTLRTYEGQDLSLSRLRGRVVVLNFWSSWCPPCKDEAPVLEKVYQRYKGQGVVMLGINVWDKGADARQFLYEQGITYTNGVPTTPVAAEYGLTGIPETFVVDPRGVLISRWIGPVGDSDLSEMIVAALPAERHTR